MSAEGMVLLAVIGIAFTIYFRRELLKLIIFTGIMVGVVYVWSLPNHEIWLKVGLTFALFTAFGALIKKLNLDDKSVSGSSRKQQKSSTYKPTCSTCNGTGRKLCYACSGSGQGPGGLGNVLGKSVNCFHCSGTGYVRCNCR